MKATIHYCSMNGTEEKDEWLVKGVTAHPILNNGVLYVVKRTAQHRSGSCLNHVLSTVSYDSNLTKSIPMAFNLLFRSFQMFQ